MTRCDLSNPRARCPVCGFVARRRDGRLVVGAIRNCPSPRPIQILPRLNVGDWIEAILTACGITAERVQRWTRSASCGCEPRKRRMNAACHRLAERGDAAILRAWSLATHPLRRITGRV